MTIRRPRAAAGLVGAVVIAGAIALYGLVQEQPLASSPDTAPPPLPVPVPASRGPTPHADAPPVAIAPPAPVTERPAPAPPTPDARVQQPPEVLPPTPDSPPPAGAADAAIPAPPPKHERNDRRFTVRWSEGLCGERSLAELRTAREHLLAGFAERRIGEAVVRHDPSVDGATLARLSLQLQQARAAVREWIDWPPNTPPPELVVYRSAQQLRAVACASEQTIGYYDGRMHVAVDSELGEAVVDQTVTHEYVHFALNTLGIPRPMWLHEGLAMHVAGETWWRSSQLDLARWLKLDHLPFDAMVFAFPHTADEKFALAAYFQSYRMVDFIQVSAGPQAARELVRRLASGATDQDAAFAVGAGLTASTLERHWQDFVQQ